MSNILIKRILYEKSKKVPEAVFQFSIAILFFGIVIVLALIYTYSALIEIKIIGKIFVYFGFIFGLVCIAFFFIILVVKAVDAKKYYSVNIDLLKSIEVLKLSKFLNERSIFINNFVFNNSKLKITEQQLSDLFHGLKNNFESIQIIKYNIKIPGNIKNPLSRSESIITSYEYLRANNPKLKTTSFIDFIFITFDRKFKEHFKLSHRDWLKLDDYVSNLKTLQKINYLANEYTDNNVKLLTSKNMNSLRANLLKNEENVLNFYPFYGLSNLSTLTNLKQLVLDNSIFSESFFNTLIANIREMNLKYFKFYDNVSMEFCCQNTNSIKKMFEVILRRVEKVDIELFFNNSNIKYSNLTYKVNDFPYNLYIKIAGRIRNQYFKNRDKLIYKNII